MLLNEYKKAKEQEVSRYTELQICSAGAQGANPYPAIQVTAVTAQAVPRLVTLFTTKKTAFDAVFGVVPTPPFRASLPSTLVTAALALRATDITLN